MLPISPSSNSPLKDANSSSSAGHLGPDSDIIHVDSQDQLDGGIDKYARIKVASSITKLANKERSKSGAPFPWILLQAVKRLVKL